MSGLEARGKGSAEVEELVCSECGMPMEGTRWINRKADEHYCLRHEDEDREFRPPMVPTIYVPLDRVRQLEKVIEDVRAWTSGKQHVHIKASREVLALLKAQSDE